MRAPVPRVNPMTLSKEGRTSQTFESSIVFNDQPAVPCSNVERKRCPAFESSICFDDGASNCTAEYKTMNSNPTPSNVGIAEGLVAEDVDTTKNFFGAGKRRVMEPVSAASSGIMEESSETAAENGRRRYGDQQFQSSQMNAVMKLDDNTDTAQSSYRASSEMENANTLHCRTSRRMCQPQIDHSHEKVSSKKMFSKSHMGDEMPKYMQLQMNDQMDIDRAIKHHREESSSFAVPNHFENTVENSVFSTESRAQFKNSNSMERSAIPAAGLSTGVSQEVGSSKISSSNNTINPVPQPMQHVESSNYVSSRRAAVGPNSNTTSSAMHQVMAHD